MSKPRQVDNSHCEIVVRDRKYAYLHKKIVVECDWEFNPMIGMVECNICGMTK